MSVRSGKLRDFARFQIRRESADLYGNPKTEWEPYASRYGFLMEKSAPETVFAGAVHRGFQAELTVREDSTISALPTKARVSVRGRWWNVVGGYRRVGETAAERGFRVFSLEAVA